MEPQLTPVDLDATFKFACHCDVPCFNECCRDLNQFLTPYDVLRLKTHFQLSSSEFLKQYTRHHAGPETGLPVVTIKPRPGKELLCPFVSPEGCQVYENRPSSCRTYPIVRLASRSRESGNIGEQYYLLEEAHCQGFQQPRLVSVRQWVKEQGLAEYNALNDLLMEIISLKNQHRPGPLDAHSEHLFYTACYDLDSFRLQVFQNRLIEKQEIEAKNMAAAQTDDVSLLKLGFDWIKQSMFA
jgi:Fe-S-cluster containining protein